MMCSHFCSSHNPPLGHDSDCPSPGVTVQALDVSLFVEDMASKQQKSDEDAENHKQTMQSLCKSFIKKYENTGVFFEPTTLANDLNAKLRRVYDMTNILEGGGIIEKVEKGSYKWSSHDNDDKEIYREKNDWYCLRNISSELKDLFVSCNKGLTCHEIYDIMTSKKKGKFNPATIRRRIYECCKVFLIVGLVQKVGKFFYNAKLTYQDIQLLATKNSHSLQGKIQLQNLSKLEKLENQKNSPKKFNKLVENASENSKVYNKNQERSQKIKQIVSELKNEEDLMKFIEDLTNEFKIKNSLSTVQSSQDIKMEEQSQFLFPNNYTWTQDKRIEFLKRRESEETYFSPQNNRRTIILSSPIKDKSPLIFSPNSSFCSFPSHSTLQNLCNLKPAFDIKGK